MRTFVGLGGNVGDTHAAFALAVGELRTMGSVVRASSLYASTARDRQGQPDFTNAAVELAMDLEPADLLLTLKRLELALGRDPQGTRFGPRTIDLDILSFDGRCVEDADLPAHRPPPTPP